MEKVEIRSHFTNDNSDQTEFVVLQHFAQADTLRLQQQMQNVQIISTECQGRKMAGRMSVSDGLTYSSTKTHRQTYTERDN